jgi:hypothetical protein
MLLRSVTYCSGGLFQRGIADFDQAFEAHRSTYRRSALSEILQNAGHRAKRLRGHQIQTVDWDEWRMVLRRWE